MKVDLLPQVVHRHRRALDVPPRPSLSKLRGPRRLVGPGASPQNEVKRVPLRLRPNDAEQVLVAKLAQHAAARQAPEAPGAAVLADTAAQGVLSVGTAACLHV